MKYKTQCQIFWRVGFIASFLAFLSIIEAFGLNTYDYSQQAQKQFKLYLVKGKVTDTKGIPLLGVTVLVKGTTLGTATDNDGNFSLSLAQKQGELIFSFVGYKTLFASYEADKFLEIRLDEDLNQLDEVQVIAYGKQTKREMTGSMSVVTASQIKEVPSVSVSNLLQGKVAGMNVVNMSGAPGSGGTTVSIRGFNSLSIEPTRYYSEPLYVIDGVPMLTNTSFITGTSPLSEIDPLDIESVSVLKDAASAAIYGSRAANGVVLITTKQGVKEQKPKISFYVTHSIAFRPDIPLTMGGNMERRFRNEALVNYREAFFDPEANAYRYATSLENSYYNNTGFNYFWNKGEGRDIPILQDSLNPLYNNSTNWYKQIFRRTYVTNANIQINGGAKRMAYNIGLGYYNEKGTVINSAFKRLKLISNLNMKPHERIESNLRIYLAYTNRDRTGESYGIYYTGEDVSNEELPKAVDYSTLLPGEGNPIYDAWKHKTGEIKEINDSYRARANFDFSFEIIKGLKLKSTVAADFGQQNQNTFIPSTLDEYKESYSGGQIGRNLVLLNENLLTFKQSFGGHTVDAVVGFSFESVENNSMNAFKRGGPSDLIQYATWTTTKKGTFNRDMVNYFSDYDKATSVSVFGRLGYNFKQKYLLSVTLRKDASSKFGENVRWGTFPSYAIAYAFSEEKFMDWAKNVLDYGKIRLSWGKSGRQFDQPYISFGLLVPGPLFLGESTVQPQLSDGLINRKLTWEETRQFDFGFDLDLFKHRFSVTFDFYHRYTDKLLYPVQLPGNYNGFAQQWQNAFGILNQGIEIMLQGDVVRSPNLVWNISFNLAKNWNMLKKSNNGRDLMAYRRIDNINIIGKPLNGILAYEDKGLYQNDAKVPVYWEDGRLIPLMGANGNNFYQAGDRILTDVDYNTRIKESYPLADDRIYCASPLPKVQGGINSTLKWKNIDLNISLVYILGRHILNKFRYASLATSTGLTANDVAKPLRVNPDDLNFWSPNKPNAEFPMNVLSNNGLHNFETNLVSNIEKVNYLKGKSLTVGYNLPDNLKETWKIGIRVFVTVENLFTWTNYSGNDPETVSLLTGIDKGKAYPLPRKLTFGLNLNF